MDAVWLVMACLVTFATLAILSLTNDSATFDETAHVAAGLSYLERGDFRLNPEHPPLAKIWAAIPLWLSGAGLDYHHAAWGNANPWELGYTYLNGPKERQLRLDPRPRLISARLMMLIVGLGLGILVFRWSLDLWGLKGALISLFCYSFSPSILAHTRLVATDLPAALGFTIVLWAFQQYCSHPNWKSAIVLGVTFGFALLVKNSLLILVPLLVLFFGLWAVLPGASPLSRSQKLLAVGGALGGTVFIALTCIWTCYGFHFASSPKNEYEIPWNEIRRDESLVTRGVEVLRAARVLPESYLFGVGRVFSDRSRPAFLDGRISANGWRRYFPEVFLMKTTPAILLIIVLIMIWSPKGRRPNTFGKWLPLTSIAAYGIIAVAFGLNIGHRHLLPIYPLLFIMAGSVAHLLFCKNLIVRVGLWTLLASHCFSSLSASPNYLSYFNLIGGGSTNAWHHFVDSNIDWGQDLSRLKSFMVDRQIPRVHLAYFGTGDPKAYGISYFHVYRYLEFEPEEEDVIPDSGYLAVSVTLLQGMYVYDPRIRSWLSDIRVHRKPVARVGDSILIYRLP